MKKLDEITIVGASSFIYDILQKVIEILLTKEIMILEIGQSESKDTKGNLIISMIYQHSK